MRYLSPKEKVKLLNSVTAENMDDLKEIIPCEALSEDPISHRVIAKVDLRQRILDGLQKSDLSQRQLALRLGIYPQNLNAFFKSEMSLPIRVIEEMLWYVENNVQAEQEDIEQRIIKTEKYE